MTQHNFGFVGVATPDNMDGIRHPAPDVPGHHPPLDDCYFLGFLMMDSMGRLHDAVPPAE